MKKLQTSLLILLLVATGKELPGQGKSPAKLRLLISTDIGGTDPDDNQSFTHFLMYANEFDTEGLVSSPSYGSGSKEEILRMIDLYEKDLPLLLKHKKGYPSPGYLRAVTKQGRKGAAPYKGYGKATEGSDWIVRCAEKRDKRPLWVLVWGGLDDLAQALHDAPDIRKNIRVYWIGGPNKKWSANSYAYIAKNFPDLWFIENNSTYRGFFSSGKNFTEEFPGKAFYRLYIKGAGSLGKDFQHYYDGEIKMGDTPSLLYLLNGNPDDPTGPGWGGQFEKLRYSPRYVFDGKTSGKDTVGVYAVLEFHFKGQDMNIPVDSSCFRFMVKAKIGLQDWPGYAVGSGDYGIRYVPKQAENLSYEVTSEISSLDGLKGAFVVDNRWPPSRHATDYKLGTHWYTGLSDPKAFTGLWQGAKTIEIWRNDILSDWAERWSWLKNEEEK